MRSGLGVVPALVLVSTCASAACAQWCGDSIVRDWTVETQAGGFGYRKLYNICSMDETRLLVFGEIGQIGITGNTIMAGGVALLVAGTVAIGLAIQRPRARRH